MKLRPLQDNCPRCNGSLVLFLEGTKEDPVYLAKCSACAAAWEGSTTQDVLDRVEETPPSSPEPVKHVSSAPMAVFRPPPPSA